jgi:hypothetical protein
MENSISVKELKEILSNFPSSTKIIYLYGGTIFSFESNILCFRKFPISEINCSFEYRLINKMLDSFFDENEPLKIEKDAISISFKNKTSVIEMTEPELPPRKMLEIIRGIRRSEKSFILKDREEFREAILFSCSVARKDNLSGLLDCIVVTEKGEIISSDNIRALKIKVKDSFSETITIEAKKAYQFFKSKEISKIILFDSWTGFYEKASKMCYCVKNDFMGKYPVEKFKEFFLSTSKEEGEFFTFPEEAKKMLKKISGFADGKSDVQKTATIEFKNKNIIFSVNISGGRFVKKIPYKNSKEFTMTVNPSLFIAPDEDIKLKILKNTIYYKKENFEYIMAIGE